MTTKLLEAELDRCLTGWRAYERDLIKQGLVGPLIATAVGWKVADLNAFLKVIDTLLPLTEQVHIGVVNDRFIGSFVLKTPLSAGGIGIVKVLQRRPGSDDPLGLDHIDFLTSDLAAAQKALIDVKANWEEQHNDKHSWLSVRFGEVLEYEAKFVDHSVLDVCIAELKDANKSLVK